MCEKWKKKLDREERIFKNIKTMNVLWIYQRSFISMIHSKGMLFR